MSDQIKLLPCPFCGDDPRVDKIIPFGEKEPKAFSITCGGACPMMMVTTGDYDGDMSRAAYAWNTRKEGK